jgi:hypothetical protein
MKSRYEVAIPCAPPCKTSNAPFHVPSGRPSPRGGTIVANAARDAGTELVANNSQFQNRPEAPSFRNLQHRPADRIFNWAQGGAVHLQAPPYYENLRALVARSVSEQGTVFLPWGDGIAVFPLVSAEDVSRVAATLLANAGLPSTSAYELLGEVPTVNEIILTLEAVLQKPIRYVLITNEQWKEAVRDRVNPHALDHLSHLWQYFRSSRSSGIIWRSLADYVVRRDSVFNPTIMEESTQARSVHQPKPVRFAKRSANAADRGNGFSDARPCATDRHEFRYSHDPVMFRQNAHHLSFNFRQDLVRIDSGFASILSSRTWSPGA